VRKRKNKGKALQDKEFKWKPNLLQQFLASNRRKNVRRYEKIAKIVKIP
jgi:hypothetical protein